MVQKRCRLWNITAAAVALLIFYNIYLTAKLMYTNDCPSSAKHHLQLKVQPPLLPVRPPQPPPCAINHLDLTDEQATYATLDLRLGRWDTKRTHKLFDNIAIGDKYADLNEEYLVCLATQSSLEKLHSLVEVAHQWTGPISAALYAAGDDELNLLLLYVLYLRNCFPNIRNRVNFHLATPAARQAKILDVDVTMASQLDCKRPDVVLQQLLKKRSSATAKWRTKYPYPQNHLRNVARKNCQSGYVFLTDVDIVPSGRLAEQLDVFLKKTQCSNKKLCAYVIPTYELDTRVRFPPNKTELVRLANKGLARPFHHKVFIYNQYATNFSRWQSGGVSEDQEVHISHPVTNFEFLYEPFYVAPDTAPPHDERFVGYGYTRNTQVYEMYVAGYEFHVLSPIFTCHWGLQVKRTRPPWREHQNNENRKLFETFKREVFAKYNKDPLNMATGIKKQ